MYFTCMFYVFSESWYCVRSMQVQWLSKNDAQPQVVLVMTCLKKYPVERTKFQQTNMFCSEFWGYDSKSLRASSRFACQKMEMRRCGLRRRYYMVLQGITDIQKNVTLRCPNNMKCVVDVGHRFSGDDNACFVWRLLIITTLSINMY